MVRVKKFTLNWLAICFWLGGGFHSITRADALSNAAPAKVETASNAIPAKVELAASNAIPAKAEVAALPEKTAFVPKIIVAANAASDTNAPVAEPAAIPVSPLVTTNLAPEPGKLVPPDPIVAPVSKQIDHSQQFQLQLDLAREQRRGKSFLQASQTLTGLLQTNSPAELKRPALFELALVAQDDDKLLKAQQIFGQYVHLYPNDPSIPEVLLRQGMIYRQMGLTTMAVAKFYSVMSTALKLKLDNMDYYKKLVLQAQVEIADTYYMDAKYPEAADFFGRLLKSDAGQLNQAQIQYKLVRSLSFLTNTVDTIAKAQVFLEQFPNAPEVPEVRFLLASSFKKLGRNQESMKEVLTLLKTQEQNVTKSPETWTYWQQRAGNEIANQLYKEGDYLSALQIYLSLSNLDPSPAWQMPAWYQSALIYEQLQQWPKAEEMYQRILDRQKELTGAAATPSLLSLLDMAKWRKDYIGWVQNAKMTNQIYLSKMTNSPDAAATP